MKLKVPPALVFLIHFGLVWFASAYLEFAEFSFPGQRALTQVLGTAGVAIAIIAMGYFRRAGTTVNPVEPDKASQLITGGVYQLSRNPMYLSLTLILMAWVTWKGNALMLLFVGTFIWYMTRFQIIPEEEALEIKFGDRYREYKKQVRRWI